MTKFNLFAWCRKKAPPKKEIDQNCTNKYDIENPQRLITQRSDDFEIESDYVVIHSTPIVQENYFGNKFKKHQKKDQDTKLIVKSLATADFEEHKETKPDAIKKQAQQEKKDQEGKQAEEGSIVGISCEPQVDNSKAMKLSSRPASDVEVSQVSEISTIPFELSPGKKQKKRLWKMKQPHRSSMPQPKDNFFHKNLLLLKDADIYTEDP